MSILSVNMKSTRSETSWRVDGKNRYMWVFVTEEKSLYLTGSRSHEVPEKVLGKKHYGAEHQCCHGLSSMDTGIVLF